MLFYSGFLNSSPPPLAYEKVALRITAHTNSRAYLDRVKKASFEFLAHLGYKPKPQDQSVMELEDA